MDRKRLKIALSVLDAVRNRFPKTNEIIESTLSKEEIKTKLLDSMTIDEVVKFDDLNKEAGKIEDLEKR